MERDAVNEKPVKSDLPKVDRLTDETIDYTDIPALDAAFFRRRPACRGLRQSGRGRSHDVTLH